MRNRKLMSLAVTAAAVSGLLLTVGCDGGLDLTFENRQDRAVLVNLPPVREFNVTACTRKSIATEGPWRYPNNETRVIFKDQSDQVISDKLYPVTKSNGRFAVEAVLEERWPGECPTIVAVPTPTAIRAR